METKTGRNNTRSAMGRMSLTMMAAFAELERNLIAERISMALRHKRDQGKVYSSTPYGFQRNGDDLSPHPAACVPPPRPHREKFRRPEFAVKEAARLQNLQPNVARCSQQPDFMYL